MALPVANNQDAIAWTDLHLSPVALDLGFFQLRWYSLAYLAGIFVGYWYLLKLVKQPGSPMVRRHADDMVFFAALEHGVVEPLVVLDEAAVSPAAGTVPGATD